jgi:hypothetical protein
MSESDSKKIKSKSICTFYQRGACTKGDECQFSHAGPRFNENTSTSTGGAKSKVDSAGCTKPKVDSAGCTKPKVDSAGGTKPKVDSVGGAKTQPVCPWGFNCPIRHNGCPNNHFKMCPYGTECNKDGCFYYHYGK